MQTLDPKNWVSWYWIDALCINQINGDDNEKTLQIEGMRDTYENAKQTIIWLGPGSTATTRALRHLDRTPNCTRSYLEEVRATLCKDQAVISAIDGFFGNSYWSRAWILQEIAASMKGDKTRSAPYRIRLTSGTSVLPWDKFIQISRAVGKMRLLSSDIETLRSRKGIERIYHIDTFCSTYGHGVNTDVHFGQLIFMSRESEASKSHDYVYALLGLIDWHTDEEKIAAEYKRSGCAAICLAIRRILEVEIPRLPVDYASVKGPECERLAKSAQHNPFNYSSELERARSFCTGVHHTASCGRDICPDSHCDALEVCRKIAITLEKHWDQLFSRIFRGLDEKEC